MLVPGVTFLASGRVSATVGPTTAAQFQGQGGFGFMNDGSLAIDTDAPAGTTFVKGIRLNSTGAIYGTTVQAATDVWLEGIRLSSSGQLVYESADPTSFTSRNPITAAGNFAVT